MRRDEAIALLKRRIRARQTNDQAELNKLDRQISAAVSKKEWPELARPDSARPISSPPKSAMSVGGPGSKWEEQQAQYTKAPPPKDWEA
jgi:hypothetical protein